MADFDPNPFADPAAVNPFQDPSVTDVTNASQRGIMEKNPFADQNKGTTIPATTPAGPDDLAKTQPAVMQPTEEPSYTPQGTVPVPEQLRQQQQELERKAAELDRREQELQDLSSGTSKNNWPPLPSFCPVKPCFYQDFALEIPLEFQRTVKILYYLWIFHVVTLLLNVLGTLAWFIAKPDRGIDFGMSILWVVLFVPCSFFCWYRPVYKAFRSDSSFNFFLFFFVFAAQFVIHIIQALGLKGWGNCGWISAIDELRSDTAPGAIMIIIAILFTISAVFSLIMLKRVHSRYRHTDASFQKAQEEFAQGVFSNRNVQNAAVSGVRRAV
uniref:Secretory carrier-associated membrane protein n=1 Tax=Eptatretus burgeri TaxID=7764 RepID=A0A8C4Q791_EPTBU